MEIDNSHFVDRFIIAGKSVTRSMWVSVEWENAINLGYYLPDGRNFREVVIDGEYAGIADQIWAKVDNPGELGDILWNTGTEPTIVSDRFAAAVRELGFTGFGYFPLDIHRYRGEPITGYGAFIIENVKDLDAPVRYFSYKQRSGFELDVTAELLAGLKERGVDQFAVRDAQEAWQEFQDYLNENPDEGSDGTE